MNDCPPPLPKRLDVRFRIALGAIVAGFALVAAPTLARDPGPMPAPADTPLPLPTDVPFPAPVESPLPPFFGVYARDGDKLVSLAPLVVDPPLAGTFVAGNVAQSSAVHLASGAVSFVVYRIGAAKLPAALAVYDVARVSRGVVLDDADHHVIASQHVAADWHVLDTAHAYVATPVEGNPEMVAVHPAPDAPPLAPGRYALALDTGDPNDGYYDFTVGNGNDADPSRCVVRVTGSAATDAPDFRACKATGIAPPTFVDDAAHMFSRPTIAALDRAIGDFENRSGKEVVVVTVPTTNGKRVADAASRAFAAHAVDGALVFIARRERRDRMIGLDSSVWLSASLKAMNARFQHGDFNGGIATAVKMIIARYPGS